jgi:hypothetical protein
LTRRWDGGGVAPELSDICGKRKHALLKPQARPFGTCMRVVGWPPLSCVNTGHGKGRIITRKGFAADDIFASEPNATVTKVCLSVWTPLDARWESVDECTLGIFAARCGACEHRLVHPAGDTPININIPTSTAPVTRHIVAGAVNTLARSCVSNLSRFAW